MDSIDIYQRVCRKVNFILDNPPKADLSVETTPEPSIYEEEEEEEEVIDCKAVKMELECLKRRIQKLQLKLKLDVDVCPDDPCVDYEIELSCSHNKEICELQKNAHKLQCQINELIRCCNAGKDQIRDLRERLCFHAKEINKLQETTIELIDWRNTLALEFGVCLERFRYLKTVKAEWTEVAEVLQKEKKKFYHLEKDYVPKEWYERELAEQQRRMDALERLVLRSVKRPQIAVKMCQPPKKCRKKKRPLNKVFPFCTDKAIIKDENPRKLFFKLPFQIYMP
ncbi:uncharacterized protein LOC119684436 [Teleopsis dalmanni]|uniref:uncharacterized protein LOC119684436 n=1 Tax=Teleopsis dalmanni TaxID=139649 RepID=UPI0018CF9DB9|nr:uncharacterized protein LOC119684436 [Teleopsis dalmanni]